MKLPFLEFKSDDFTRSQFDAIPIPGYVTPKNDKTGKTFPYCCDSHSQFYEHVKGIFANFPNCCEAHAEIAKNPLVKIENYKSVPEKILNQCSYTQHHIIKRVHNQDWLADITEYIEYNIFSFGHPDIGLEHYLNYLLLILDDKAYLSANNVPFAKAEKIAEFIIKVRSPADPKEQETSMTVLYETYQKWLKVFPFELSYFKDLRLELEKGFPFVKEQVSYNRYLGLHKARIHTKGSLIEFLLNTTNDILTTINTVGKYQEWNASDADRIKLEIIVEQRKMKLSKGYHNNSKNEETRYRKILKEWFKDEKKFIDEVKPLLPVVPLLQNHRNKEPMSNLNPETEQYKKQLAFLPKEEKINIIKQELTNRGLSRIPIPGSSISNRTEEVFSPSDDQLLLLQKEIENNVEAYESKTKRKELIPYMYDRDLNWFFNAKNIPAQDKLVMPTYEYFTEGPGKEFFEPLDFFNLLEKQYKELMTCLDKPFDFLTHLKSIPLSARESHILFGFILMWFGGYPVHNLNDQFNVILKLIEKEFLKFNETTPEKEFCKVDFDQRKKFMMLSISGTTAMNTGLDWATLYKAMENNEPVKKVKFDNFNDLFDTAIRNNAVGPFENEVVKLIDRDIHQLGFNVWLQKTKNWEYGNEEQYKTFLTKGNFLAFLHFEAEEKRKAIEAQEKEAETWQVNLSKNDFSPKEPVAEEPRLSIPAYALMHVYLSMFNGQPVTQQNKNELAAKYGYKSGDQLRNDFTSYQNEDKRLDIHPTNKKSANAHLGRFKQILPLLEKTNTKAYEKAKADLVILQKEYNKHH